MKSKMAANANKIASKSEFLKTFLQKRYCFQNCSAKSFLFQSTSMNLQRGNALCVMGTVAHHRKLEEIYNLGTIQTQEQEG